jgi:hypothetical protein
MGTAADKIQYTKIVNSKELSWHVSRSQHRFPRPSESVNVTTINLIILSINAEKSKLN